MFIRGIMLILLTGLVAVFPACGPNQPFHQPKTLEENWGKSFQSQKDNQILNPEAGKDLAPAAGLDGQAALKAVEKYREGDREKAPPPTEFGVVTIKQ